MAKRHVKIRQTPRRKGQDNPCIYSNRIQDSLQDQYRFQISPKGILVILLRVGDACAPEYEHILQQIRAARWRHADETSMPVMGKNSWLWLFRTECNEVLVAIRPSRGKKMLEEILGAGFQGAMVNDGYSSYQWLPVMQRCWAHLLREVNHGDDLSDHEQRFSIEMHRRFDALKEFIGKDPPTKERIEQKTAWDQELQMVVEEYCTYDDTRVKAQYIQHGLGSWHTCLMHPGCSRPTILLSKQSESM